MKKYVKKGWIYQYKKQSEEGKRKLIKVTNDKFKLAFQDIDLTRLVDDYIKELDTELDNPKMCY